MSKKHKKRKKSRRERRGQPHVATVDQAASQAASDGRPSDADSGGAVPDESAAPEQPTAAEPQSPARPTVTATFKPSQPAAAPAQPGPAAPTAPTTAEEAEYTSVRKDLRKLSLTIVALIVVVAGTVVVNDQTGFVNALGEQLFHLWG